MFSILKKIFIKTETAQSDTSVVDSTSASNVLQDKIETHYGKQNINQQQLFEKWCCKEYWNLKQEAVPLVFGLDPNDDVWKSEMEINQQIEELYQHALHCIKNDLSLSVVNSESNDTEWQVIPVDFYRWAAVSRVTLPEKLTALMDFIITTVKNSSFTTDDKSQAISPEASSLSMEFDKQTEVVLGAALNLLARYPDKCKTERGKVVARKIASEIVDSAEQWFGEADPKLSLSAVEDLLNKWLIKK